MTPICFNCRRIRSDDEGRLVCQAFPDGIPKSILRGEADHTKPVEGDHGLRFIPGPPDED